MASSKQTLLKVFLFLICCCWVFADRLKREEAVPDLCQEPSVDAATSTEDGRTYFFKGDYYWELKGVDTSFIPKDYPRKISEDWIGLPGNLDAVLTFADGNTLFFKENLCWRFKNKNMISGYPKKISDELEGIPNCLDGAVVWGVDGKAYFFKGSNYWLYPNEENSPNPHNISNLEGMPSDIDAALTFVNKRTYLFKGRGYYRSDEKHTVVSKDDVGGRYPRSNAAWWFGCQTTSNEDLTNETSNRRNDNNPICMDEDDTIRSSTHISTEKDYMDGSTKLDVHVQLKSDSAETTPSPHNEVEDANSATFPNANLLLTFLLVAFLH